MTEESEKAARWDMVERLQKAKSHLVTLENTMEKLGDSLAAFAQYLRSPHGIETAEAGAQSIVGRNLLSKVETFRITKDDLSWDSIYAILDDYKKTQFEKEKLSTQIKSLGIELGS